MKKKKSRGRSKGRGPAPPAKRSTLVPDHTDAPAQTDSAPLRPDRAAKKERPLRDLADVTGVPNLVVVADLHVGCELGLCPPLGWRKDAGGNYLPSALQRKVWGFWEEFWDEWVPARTKGEPFCTVVLGDPLEGIHHGVNSQWTQNLTVQAACAEAILRPIVKRTVPDGFFMVRGTEAHGGASGQAEEDLARTLGARRNTIGQHAWWELWKRVGGKGLAHLMHHIGSTGSSHYESTAVHKEIVEEFTEAGRWNEERPSIVVRAHRHRGIMVTVPTEEGPGISAVTAGWQAKTPLAYRLPSGRMSPPQFGGILLRQGDQDFYCLQYVRSIKRERPS